MVRTFLAIVRRSRIQRCRLLTGALAALALAAPASACATFPGANGRIFFSGHEPAAGTPDVYSVRPDGEGLVNLTDLPGGNGTGADPSVSSGSERIAFFTGAGAASEIWAMGADGSHPVRLTTNSSSDEQPAISPDGTRIAWVADDDIWTMNADGSGATLLVDGADSDLMPEFSPDGRMVVFASRIGSDFDIAYAPSTGGPYAPAPLSDAMPADELSPSVRPDSSRVAFARGNPGDIYDAFFDGTDELPIATGPDDQRSPAYSPDGTQIAYDTGSALVIASSGGANPRPLDTGDVEDPGDPYWAEGDLEPPQTKITKGPRDEIEKRRATFRFKSSQRHSSFECRLDRKRWKHCESPLRLTRLDPGRHRFKVRATDPAGNVDPTPAHAKFRVAR